MVTPVEQRGTLARREVVARLLIDRGDLLVVSGLGSPSYDLYAAGDSDRNFYLWGAMGSAALVGLGLAQARREDRVLVITGDGEQLMGLGGLATIGVARPANLTVVVLDNGHFGETGMQRSHSSLGVSLTEVARSCRFPIVLEVGTHRDVDALRHQIHSSDEGPVLAVVPVAVEQLARTMPPRDAVFLKNRFRQQLGLPVS